MRRGRKLSEPYNGRMNQRERITADVKSQAQKRIVKNIGEVEGYLVADVAEVLLVVGHELARALDIAIVELVVEEPVDGYHHRLLHLVRHHRPHHGLHLRKQIPSDLPVRRPASKTSALVETAYCIEYIRRGG